ncbi:axonemal dynein heavy chain, partial [Thraustotheca clavata]
MENDREMDQEAYEEEEDKMPLSHQEQIEKDRLLLEQRFRLHKRMRKQAKERLDNLKSKAARKKESHVDYQNLPHKWKEGIVLEEELKRREQLKILRGPEPVRAFPGRIRATSPLQLDSEFERQQQIEEYAKYAAENEHSANIELDEFLKLDQSQFPLHQFDSSEYETKSPDEWLALTKNGASPFFVKNEWRWRPCIIDSYNSLTDKYTIQFQGSDKQKQVRRINLRFDIEDPAVFQRRIEEAMLRREEAKAHMRFDYFIAQQNTIEPRAMGRPTLEGIHRRVVEGLTPEIGVEENHANILKSLTDVVIRDYARSMKKAVLAYRLKFDANLLIKYSSLNLTPITTPLPAPYFGKIQIPTHQYEKAQRIIGRKHYTALSGFLTVLLKIYHGWDTSFRHLTFCSTSLDQLTLPCHLAEFDNLQLAHCTRITEMLAVDWRRAISENLVDSLQDTQDFFISDREAYANGLLKRLLMSIRVRMATQIRLLVEQSTYNWVSFVEAAVKRTLPKVDMTLPQTSIFAVELAINDDGIVEMVPSPQDIKNVMLAPFDTMVQNVSAIEVIDPDLLSLLNLERIKLFDISVKDEVVYETVTKIATARRDVVKFLNESINQVQSVADSYSKHAELIGVDADLFMKHFKQNNPAPISLDEVETLSFDVTSFSLICVSALGLKSTLRLRGTAIRDALIEYIVTDAREKNIDITRRYQVILHRITEKPSNEGELAALKDFINVSKGTIAGIILEVEEIHTRLHALHEFSHTISDDDFRLAWSTKEWPLRVAHAADTCDSALEEDKIRMMDKLALEKEAFELDLERFEKEVGLFKSYGEIDMTDKYVEMASTLYDAICEAKTKAENFNQREAVFGFRPTEYAMITKLEADFNPYYKLWTMCAEFNISKQAWLTGPFLELKGGEIEANVTEWWKASYKLSKQLAEEAPGSAE